MHEKDYRGNPLPRLAAALDKLTKEQAVLEEVAKKLYSWIHTSGSPEWDSRKVPEVVRVSYRKRANELMLIIKEK